MKRLIIVSALILSASLAQAGLYINAGNIPDAGIGPNGSNVNYLAYNTGTHEASDVGAQEIFGGVTFAEGGIAGTYDVGVEYTFPDTTADTVKQSYGRQNLGGNSTFYEDWIGIDVRAGSGGNGVGTTLRLNLTGLPANQEFTLTSYHFDTQDQAGTFTTSLTGTDVFAFGKDVDKDGTTDPAPFAYDFTLTSDALGNASIDYQNASGSWTATNGFDLVAIPEPATLGLITAFGGSILFIRRRFMM
ncbi:hypothetical protein P4C99_11810 [Pontiellaceae bacterium B1224]|nr:hypothetical protein [Pontiellaceae bacterium B1224]